MWLVTPFGSFSIVRRTGENLLTVSARAKADLDRMRSLYVPSLSATVETAEADYPYRVTVSAQALAQAVGRMVEDIDYSTFSDPTGGMTDAADGCGEMLNWTASGNPAVRALLDHLSEELAAELIMLKASLAPPTKPG